MTELTGHPVYRLLDTSYPDCLLDFVVLQLDGPYEGENTHKQAVLEAFALLNGRERIAGRLRIFALPDEKIPRHCAYFHFSNGA